MKQWIYTAMGEAGFARARILSPFQPEYGRTPAPALLIGAFPYGNQNNSMPDSGCVIAPFARKNYYREAVNRMQMLAQRFRSQHGGTRSGYQILCNSPLPEKPLAAACGLGVIGRNSLVITREVSCLFIIAAMSVPFSLEPDPVDDSFNPCAGCDSDSPACVRSCPTGALRGDGTIDLSRCIQWYASGNGTGVPELVAKAWGRRLYGCSNCQDACVHSRSVINGATGVCGELPAAFDGNFLLSRTDLELHALFKGTALGLSWLSPETIRRNVRLAMR
ncbi:hypothetical protein FACS1894172_09120 [Spirochaetia bacterium]|nr:hypothetical protein FACS1894164_00920 [Spirochaetia bacterium]GHU32457.1 hypothetical protein FACS1894172_09120 [Spirochaetia bacterium]